MKPKSGVSTSCRGWSAGVPLGSSEARIAASFASVVASFASLTASLQPFREHKAWELRVALWQVSLSSDIGRPMLLVSAGPWHQPLALPAGQNLYCTVVGTCSAAVVNSCGQTLHWLYPGSFRSDSAHEALDIWLRTWRSRKRIATGPHMGWVGRLQDNFASFHLTPPPVLEDSLS
jgi:hypothetical protein